MGKKYSVVPRGVWKSEELKGLKPTVYDWCRMAAFIDGEGSVQLNPHTKQKTSGGFIFQVRIRVYNTNPALSIWLMKTFGGHLVTIDKASREHPKWKLAYYWSCTAGRAAWVLHNCAPWMLLKQEQARLVVEMQEHIDGGKHGRGRLVTDEDKEYRMSIKNRVNALNGKGPQGVTING